ncbi:hypothetical protein K445DRAFT_139682 [Daldinia sp. EC12]|nr:hypothetical protein K445DRAFT_139682 [Daldinia sp. EC12]
MHHNHYSLTALFKLNILQALLTLGAELTYWLLVVEVVCKGLVIPSLCGEPVPSSVGFWEYMYLGRVGVR